MAQSQTDICNGALQRVGAATIMDITDNSREARACAVAYDTARRAELRKRKWRFALKRATLAPDTAAPNFEYAYAFTLPSDCLRITHPADNPDLDWQLEGRKILTNTMQSPFLGASSQPTVTGPALFLRYVADIEDATQFDASFYVMLQIQLAIAICEPLTQSNTKKQGLQAEYKDALMAAAKAQAFETLPADPPADGWWLARVS
jgi:hypothetical protein